MWNQVRKSSIVIGLMLAMLAESHSQTLKRPESFGDSEYRLGPEDVIEVFVWKEDDLTTSTVVRPDGKVTVPLVGEIVASNKTAGELEEEIKAKLLKYLTLPVVNVVVKEVNSPKVSVFGEVNKPDVYRIKQKTSVFDVIAQAGGFTEFAKREKVIVIRNDAKNPEKFNLNLKEMINNGGGVFYVQPGDTVYVQ